MTDDEWNAERQRLEAAVKEAAAALVKHMGPIESWSGAKIPGTNLRVRIEWDE